jgi:acyl-CoA synthetase (AMP-forming)/AMP-acid ligase II
MTADPWYPTLTDVLRHHAQSWPDAVAATQLNDRGGELESVSYAELDRRVRAAAALLQSQVAPGERVLVMYPAGLDFVVAFFACAYAGAVAVPVPSPDSVTGGHSTLARLQSIVKDADPRVVLSTREAAGRAGGELGGAQRLVVGDTPAELAEVWRPPAGDPAAPAFLQYTSGSTSAPKGVVITHGNVLANLSAISHDLGADRADPADVRVVSWLPPFHDMGLAHVLLSGYLGGQMVLMSPVAFLIRPAQWLAAVSRYRPWVSSAPNFAYDLCVAKVTAEQRAELDLSGWRWALSGAEPVRVETMERFTATFAPAGFRDTAFMPSYGLAEATVYVSGRRRPEDARSVALDVAELEQHRRVTEPVAGRPARRIVACGRIAGNLDVRIVDPGTGTPAAAGTAGEIWIAGDSVAAGYWQQPEATAARFGGRLPGVPDTSFLRTGDLGFVRDGLLYVLGRMDDLIIVDGRNHYPQDIELTVGGCHPALAPNLSAVFSYEEAAAQWVGIFAETARGVRVVGDGVQPRGGAEVAAADVVAAIRRAVADEHQIRAKAVVLLRPGGLPRTTSGKVQRGRCRLLFLAGEHKSW